MIRPNRVATPLENERFYVLVPETVQTDVVSWSPEDAHHPSFVRPSEVKNTKMVAGRLIAQGVHVGRMIGHLFQSVNVPYRDVTTIVLSVRNTKELNKVSNEIKAYIKGLPYTVGYGEFLDSNPELYETTAKVHTITLVGPVLKEELDEAIGHLNLY